MTTDTNENTLLAKKAKKRRQELPNCFKSGNEKLPLKIGIHLQLHFHYKDDSRFEPLLIQQAINAYVSSSKYLAKIVEGATRTAIHGNPDGQVTDEDVAFAQGKLKIRQDWF